MSAVNLLMRYLIFILMLASFAFSQAPPMEPGVSHDLAKWRAARYSDVRYKLNLTLEKMSPVLKGTIEIRLQYAAVACAEPDCPPMYIVLDWRKIPGHEKDSTVSNVNINGKTAPVIMEPPLGTMISIPHPEMLPGTPPPGPAAVERLDHIIFHDGVRMGENVIKLDFTSPILTSGSAITRYVDKEDGAEYIYSLFVPSDASTAFPVFDQPDVKARFSLEVTYPDTWKVVSNSPLIRWGVNDYAALPDITTHPDTREITFAETKPISTYVFAFAAGPFQQSAYQMGENYKNSSDTFLTRPVDPNFFSMNVYVRKSQAEKFKQHKAEVFRLTREGIKYLEGYFDYKFPFPKYDIVLIPEFPFGGMEHAGATFLRESSVIFPTEPTANDYISRANVIFHETAHQWFGDTVTMKWFDDLWLKEGFAEFMAYKTLEKVMPQYNAWKVFYERNKQAAYLTDSTKGTTPIYQPIDNLSSAKSAYGNIVYRKAPSFLRQAEFYLGEDKFQVAVRAFLKKHEYANAGWEDLVKEFEAASGQDLKEWANNWIKSRGAPVITIISKGVSRGGVYEPNHVFSYSYFVLQRNFLHDKGVAQAFELLVVDSKGDRRILKTTTCNFDANNSPETKLCGTTVAASETHAPDLYEFALIFPNRSDYGYGIFLLDRISRDYVLKNIQNEKDDFLRTMMWGSLWDSVREAELDPKDYVELVIKNIASEKDEGTIQTLLSRVSTAMRYYMSEPLAFAAESIIDRNPTMIGGPFKRRTPRQDAKPPANTGGLDLEERLEAVLLDRMQHAATPGQRITFYRAFLSTASTEKARTVLKQLLSRSVPGTVVTGAVDRKAPDWMGDNGKKAPVANALGTDTRAQLPLRAKDKFDIVTRLAILGDPDAQKLLAVLEKTETGDDAKRYAYAAHAGFATAENKAKYWNDFLTNKDISESWIEAAMVPFNSIRHTALTEQYLERALAELPNLKRSRKIFFVNGWLGAFIGGQRDEKAFAIVNKFLADNPNLDNDLRLKILENVDLIERAIKIRAKYGKN